jgi:hypothetical protein
VGSLAKNIRRNSREKHLHPNQKLIWRPKKIDPAQNNEPKMNPNP